MADDDNVKNTFATNRPPSQNENNSPSPQLDSPSTLDDSRIVRHILVIGFHHKHGYQVDYCYPPIQPNGITHSSPGRSINLPDAWKTLPLLCLPDGSHNYTSDTIYFTMPDVSTPCDQDDSKTESQNKLDSVGQASIESTQQQQSDGIKTIFGTACYRQIQADKLLNRTDDMTRVAVQKSVCVLSTKPLFGLIRSKLEMITHAYFEELDFSKVKILKMTYENLNSLLSRDSVKENATFLGLSARHLISTFGYNTLVLFKAMLLQKKILFYKSPVRDLCSTILSMCSLFTGLLEDGGLDYSTCGLQLNEELLEALKLFTSQNPEEYDASTRQDVYKESNARDDKVLYSPSKEEVVIICDSNKTASNSEPLDSIEPVRKTDTIEEPSDLVNRESYEHQDPNEASQSSEFEDISDDPRMLADGTLVDDPYALKLCKLSPDECGLPLQIFTKGSFCLPYLSITYLDLLSDARVKSFVIGATNFLFKQRRDMYDIVVDMDDNNVNIVINDQQLRKTLTLTTEDLRFMDNLSKHVKLDLSQPKDEFDLITHDITKWVGGDEWIRYQFRLYTLYLLNISIQPPSMWEPFNGQFVHCWKYSSPNYKHWESTKKAPILDGLQIKHPSSQPPKSGINMSDMKLKLSYAVNSSEKGRMINQTLNGIGKWSIWNNIASAAAAATTSAAATISSAASAYQQHQNTANDQRKRPSEAPEDI